MPRFQKKTYGVFMCLCFNICFERVLICFNGLQWGLVLIGFDGFSGLDLVLSSVYKAIFV